MTEKEFRFLATNSSGEVSALYLRPRGASRLVVLGHGAGAGMRHPFMETIARKLAEHGVATLRYQFPYIEAGRRAPNPQPVLLKTVRSAVAQGKKLARGIPLLAGGKSMGGRMTSLAASKEALEGVVGLVFLGFPLHAPGKTGSERADHLFETPLPLLFIQGTRDKLADLSRLRPVHKKLGKRSTLHIVDDGDHSLNVPKRSGRNQDEVLDDVAGVIAEWRI